MKRVLLGNSSQQLRVIQIYPLIFYRNTTCWKMKYYQMIGWISWLFLESSVPWCWSPSSSPKPDINRDLEAMLWWGCLGTIMSSYPKEEALFLDFLNPLAKRNMEVGLSVEEEGLVELPEKDSHVCFWRLQLPSCCIWRSLAWKWTFMVKFHSFLSASVSWN